MTKHTKQRPYGSARPFAPVFRSLIVLLACLVIIGLSLPARATRQETAVIEPLVANSASQLLTTKDAVFIDANDSFEDQSATDLTLLSPYWGPNIQQWSDYIAILADAYGFHPDLIAAVIKHESDGDYQVVSHMGAVGLMGIMPAGPGLEWRPSPEELLTPTVNLRWGMSILSAIVRQSGGDIYSALAAYNGGWNQINSREPRDYAAEVLDSYARALLVRSGLATDTAAQWTVAIEMVAGHVPTQGFLVLGNQPLGDLHTYAAHTLYRYADEKSGQTYHIRGYVVPITFLATPVESANLFETADASGEELLADPPAAPDEQVEKLPNRDPRVLLACLPSLDRLRGHASTRWFAPSSCPSWHR